MALVGPSSVRGGDGAPVAATLLTAVVSIFVGAGLVYVATLALARRADGSGHGWGELIWLTSVDLLGIGAFMWAFNHWLMLGGGTILDVTIGGLGLGAFSMAIARIISLTKRSS